MNQVVASALVWALTATIAVAATVTVTVNGVASADGVVRGSLCSPTDRFPGTSCEHRTAVPAKHGSVDLVFPDIAPGVYAFTTWHDANDDGKTKLPDEGFAFGNNSPVPPNFKLASFDIGGDFKSSVNLLYLARPSAGGDVGAAPPADVAKIDVREAGLHGALYVPNGARNAPTLIAISGSEGGLDIASQASRALSEHGFVVLALAYWRAPGLPPSLEEIPLEYFKKSIDWLKDRAEVDANRIGLLGISRGAEGALLVASHYRDIKAVVAVAPSSHAWSSSNMTMMSGGVSGVRPPAWTFAGEPVPFLVSRTEANGSPSTALASYETALAAAPVDSEAAIAVERINGPILLLSGTADGIWPANAMSDRIVGRLKSRRFAHAYEHKRYEDAGHMVYFGDPASSDTHAYSALGKVMGGTEDANRRARRDSWERTLKFFTRHLKDAPQPLN